MWKSLPQGTLRQWAAHHLHIIGGWTYKPPGKEEDHVFRIRFYRSVVVYTEQISQAVLKLVPNSYTNFDTLKCT